MRIIFHMVAQLVHRRQARPIESSGEGKMNEKRTQYIPITNIIRSDIFTDIQTNATCSSSIVCGGRSFNAEDSPRMFVSRVKRFV
jgi:hypothetical protein